MQKDELRQRLSRRAAELALKVQHEETIIEALPAGVPIERVFVGTKHTDPFADANGTVEILVHSIREAEGHMEALPPAALSVVRMDRNDGFTTAFYPTGRVRGRWYDEHEVMDIYPALMQITPEKTESRVLRFADVRIEWYVEVKAGFFVHVTCKLQGHNIRFEGRAKGKGQPREWKLINQPRGEYRRVKMLGDDDPAYVTVWWYHGMIGESLDEIMALSAQETAI